MKLEEVLGYTPKEELEKLSLAYNVDHQVKKLHGQTMFQLLFVKFHNVVDGISSPSGFSLKA